MSAVKWMLANRYSWIDRPGLDIAVDESFEGLYDTVSEAFLSINEAFDEMLERYPGGMSMNKVVHDDRIVVRLSGVPFAGTASWIAQKLLDLREIVDESDATLEYISPAPGNVVIVVEFPPGTISREHGERVLEQQRREQEAEAFGTAGPWIYANRYAWSSGPPRKL